MNTQLLILFTVLSLNLFAKSQEFVDIYSSDPQLSDRYDRGVHLIYDCKEKHWVCTTKALSQYCEKTRKRAIENYEYSLPCAPFKGFENEKDCNLKQLEFTHKGHIQSYCFHDKVKKHFIKF
jgi:hypothetical protein